MQTISLTIIKKSGGAISRVLSCAVICLARPSPDGSSGLPGARRAAVSLPFYLASDGACICPAHYWPGGSLLHCLFTLTGVNDAGGRSLLRFPVGFPSRTLSGILPCEARTFLVIFKKCRDRIPRRRSVFHCSGFDRFLQVFYGARQTSRQAAIPLLPRASHSCQTSRQAASPLLPRAGRS